MKTQNLISFATVRMYENNVDFELALPLGPRT
jgi:hypothetical protein